MTDSLAARLVPIDARRRALLDEVAALDPALLTAHVRPGKWSILEIVEHLVISERVVLGELDESAPRRERRRTFGNRVAYRLVMFILRFGVPVGVPSPRMAPGGERSLDDLKETWDETHRRLQAFVAGLDPEGENRTVFRHPVTGPMTVAQGVTMLGVHLDRHTRQIHRLIEEAKRTGL